jgi:hypothetical protein
LLERSCQHEGHEEVKKPRVLNEQAFAIVAEATREKPAEEPVLLSQVSTSYAERNNLTMRISMRRFTRLANAFSKKVENLEAAVALHFMHHNFARVHQSLRVTPAMEAGVADHVWSIEEIAWLLDKK